jgi:hypothetical protein
MDAHTFTEAEKIYTNFMCQKADGNCFLGQEKRADGGTHITRDHNNIRNVLRNAKQTSYGHSGKKARNVNIQCNAPP